MCSQCIPRSQDLFTYSNLFHARSHDTQFTRYSLWDLQSGLNISVFDCIWSSVHCQSLRFLEMMDNSICDTLELHIRHNVMTWKGSHLFSILHLLLHQSTVVYIRLNAPYGLYLHAYTCWRTCKVSRNYIIQLQSIKIIHTNLETDLSLISQNEVHDDWCSNILMHMCKFMCIKQKHRGHDEG